MPPKKPRGQKAFQNYYQQVFPNPTDFASFLAFLETKNQPILRFNPANTKQLKSIFTENNLTWQTSPHYPNALIWPPEIPAGETIPGYKKNLFYPMNPSSLLPVLTLDPQPGDTVLDACAAPGGKALFISELIGPTGHLIANDISTPRRARMKRLFESHQTTNTEISSRPAELLFKKFPEHFDRILLDAPCSSEKHVFTSPKHLQNWSPSRPKNLARTQYSLLCSAIQCLKPGGTLVYSTCAITPEENEQVIEKLLKKKGHTIEPSTEPTRIPQLHSFYPQPDLDPMFIAKLHKK